MGIKDDLKLVPHLPGSYQMINKDGIIIYVGKAKDLNKRLHSYFRGIHTGKTALMISEIDHFTYIVTKTETESFVLEINLIKKYDPKYNILLKDDKTYPYIEYIKNPYPRLKISRYTSVQKKDKKLIFGPYPNAYAVRRIVNLLNRLYPLKKCEGNPKKLCLYYHIGECLGYCEKNVDKDKLQKMEDEILSFLRGNEKIVIDKIMQQININSEKLNFEKALELKNELDYINILFDKQKVELHDYANRDVISFYELNGYLSIQILFIRNGKLLGGHANIVNMIDEKENELISYIYSYYQSHEIPKEIIISDIDNIEVLKSLVDSNIYIPVKGDKKALIDMAHLNAKLNLEKEINLFIQDEKRTFGANSRLGEILGTNIHTIEAFDNSNLFGTNCVSGMVVFKNGKPSKKDYRKYKMSFEKNDDYHMMKEVIYRRYYRLLMEKSNMPDLIIVDGAKNQINACKEVLDTLNLNIKVCGLKKDEHHNTKVLLDSDFNEIDLSEEADVFNYLTRIQDEVHRFAITYHKEIRSKGLLSSKLDMIDGVGPERRKALLKEFKTIDNIKNADIKDLQKIVPLKVAENLKNNL